MAVRPQKTASHSQKQRGSAFTPEAVACFEMAENEIMDQYRKWKSFAPCWVFEDVIPI